MTRGTADVAHVITGIASSSSVESAKRFYTEVVSPRQSFDVACSTYDSYEELVKDPAVDLVYISTPHSHHFQNCMTALHNGKAVLCEKPVAVNARQARKLHEVAKEKGLFFMEAVWTRFFPLSVTVRQLIKDGVIGDLLRVYVNNSTGTDVETLDASHRYLNTALAGGALLDIGVYALTWLFQTLYHTQDPEQRSPPSALSSMVEFHEPSGTDQMTSLIVRFHMPSNSTLKVAHGMATTSMVLPDVDAQGGPTVHIYGLKGEIQVWGPAHRAQSIKVIPKEGEPWARVFPIPAQGHGMFWEADEAARCWFTGKLECPGIPWDESTLVMKVVDEIRRQANIVYPKEIETVEWPVQLGARHG
jgi:predicted dehydrogenase